MPVSFDGLWLAAAEGRRDLEWRYVTAPGSSEGDAPVMELWEDGELRWRSDPRTDAEVWAAYVKGAQCPNGCLVRLERVGTDFEARGYWGCRWCGELFTEAELVERWSS